jgi:hypothetical protein
VGTLPESRWESWDKILNVYYYVALAMLCSIVIWHWIFGGRYGLLARVTVWSIGVLIVLGLLNALRLLGRR